MVGVGWPDWGGSPRGVGVDQRTAGAVAGHPGNGIGADPHPATAPQGDGAVWD